MMDVRDIFQYLPHRYPFLLVDRVTECVEGEYLKGYKNITYNEPQFTGHFPGVPIFPGVFIVEAMAQCTGILAFRSLKSKPQKNSMYYLVGIDKCRFKEPSIPGDRLDFVIKTITNKKGIWKFDAKTFKNKKLIVSAQLICAEVKV